MKNIMKKFLKTLAIGVFAMGILATVAHAYSFENGMLKEIVAGVDPTDATTLGQVTTLLAAKQNVINSYEGTTSHAGAFAIFKSATVSSGVAVFYLTADGTSTGTALFPNGVIQDSVNAFVSDATASYQMSYAFSNSNKTLTVTANKLTTSNILTGILGQAAANASVIKISVWGY